MKKLLLSLAAVAMAATATQAQTLSDLKLGILIGTVNEYNIDNPQEKAAYDWIKAECPGVKVYTPATIATLSTADVDALWVHCDRVGLEAGWANLPEGFRADATVNALKEYYNNGGGLFLSKHATQLATAIGAIDREANCFGAGDGGDGFDNWTIQAVLGCADEFESLDRRDHRVYEFMEECDDFGHPSFPVLGTGDPETCMWREDHNCFWIPADLGFGAGNGDINCILDFEAAYNCTVLGTWGHVADYCGAGVIDFNGHLVAMGLAAYELNPRSGENAYTDNIDLFTSNTLRYLAENTTSGIEGIAESNTNAPAVYYNLQGVQVTNPVAGQIYIVKAGSDVKKVVK